MMIDATQLLQEIQTDQAGLGLLTPFRAGQDQGVADLLNSLTGPGAATVSLAAVAKGDVLLGIAPAALSLPNLSAALQAKWDRAINLLLGAGETVDVASPNVAFLLGAAVADAVLTQGQVDAFTKRTGSRAEALWQPGTRVAADDVSRARSVL